MASRRRSTFVVIGGLAAALCVLAAVVGIPVPRGMFDLDRLLPRGTTQTHAATWYFPLSGRTVVSGLVIRDGGEIALTADSAGIVGYRAMGAGQALRRIDVRHLTLMRPGGNVTVATLQARNLLLHLEVPPGDGATAAERALFVARNLECGRLSMTGIDGSFAHGTIAAGKLELRDYRIGAFRDLSISDVTLHLNIGAAGTADASLQQTRLQNVPRISLEPERLYTTDAAGLRDYFQPGTPEQMQVVGLRVQSGAVVVSVAQIATSRSYDAAADAHGSETISGGAVSVAKGSALAVSPMVVALGLDGLTFSGTAVGSFDKATLRSTFGPATLAFAGLGALGMSGAIAVDRGHYQPGLMKGMVFEGFKLQWHDAGLMNRLVQFNAEHAHFGIEQSRAMLETMVERMGGLLVNQQDGGTQLAAFVDKPGTLTLSLDPPIPVALEALAAVPKAQLPAVLGLHVSGD